jgi:selenocysteine lyase/cysteine desulfurase
VLNPLADIAKVVREFDDVMLCVDAVSALAAVPIDVDGLGVDVCLAGTQKAMAMPPGLGVFTCSERALKRAASKEQRGYYMDYLQFKKNSDNDETPSTPTTAHIFALEAALQRIHGETMETRADRHRRMAKLTQDWAREHLAIFSDPNYLSPSVTCIANAGKTRCRRVREEARRARLHPRRRLRQAEEHDVPHRPLRRTHGRGRHATARGDDRSTLIDYVRTSSLYATTFGRSRSVDERGERFVADDDAPRQAP